MDLITVTELVDEKRHQLEFPKNPFEITGGILSPITQGVFSKYEMSLNKPDVFPI